MAFKSAIGLLGLFLSSNLIPGVVWGHGENKPGPHGGHIRMPGAFHTELVMKSKKELNVFLLDMEWANPTTEGSSVKVILKSGTKESLLTCETAKDHFRCKTSKGVSMALPGKVEITANRKGASGGLAVYELPLKASH